MGMVAHASEDLAPVRDAVEALGESLVVLDPAAGVIVWAAPAAATQLPKLAAGTPIATVTDLLDGLGAALRAAGDTPVRARLVHTETGAVYDATLTGRRAAGGARVYLRLEDAAERQQAQSRHLADRERLLFTSRALSVGEMASTLAHELNQPLGSIANLLRGLKARAERGPLTDAVAGPALAKAVEQVHYASAIIARIREYVHARQPRREPLDLSRLARTALDLLDWEIGRDGVRTATRLPADLPPVLGDEVMIQQVVTNLARNAIEAMRTCDPADRELTIEAAADDGRHIEMRIRDRGPGVDGSDADRLFAPFFSTKAGGTGMGLNICRSIVELHRGRLWFTPTQGGGTTFHIALPIESIPIPHTSGPST